MVSEPIRYSPQGANGGALSGMLQDISATGASMRTHQKLAAGAVMTLSLNFGVALKVEAPARIVWVRPEPSGFHFRYGMRFIGLDPFERQQIADYVSAQKHGREVGVRAFRREAER